MRFLFKDVLMNGSKQPVGLDGLCETERGTACSDTALYWEVMILHSSSFQRKIQRHRRERKQRGGWGGYKLII